MLSKDFITTPSFSTFDDIFQILKPFIRERAKVLLILLQILINLYYFFTKKVYAFRSGIRIRESLYIVKTRNHLIIFKFQGDVYRGL